MHKLRGAIVGYGFIMQKGHAAGYRQRGDVDGIRRRGDAGRDPRVLEVDGRPAFPVDPGQAGRAAEPAVSGASTARSATSGAASVVRALAFVGGGT